MGRMRREECLRRHSEKDHDRHLRIRREPCTHGWPTRHLHRRLSFRSFRHGELITRALIDIDSWWLHRGGCTLFYAKTFYLFS